jgi:hypothetical protein
MFLRESFIFSFLGRLLARFFPDSSAPLYGVLGGGVAMLAIWRFMPPQSSGSVFGLLLCLCPLVLLGSLFSGGLAGTTVHAAVKRRWSGRRADKFEPYTAFLGGLAAVPLALLLLGLIFRAASLILAAQGN